MLIAGLFPLGRAEPLAFLAVRPWLLLAAALLARNASGARRWTFYLGYLTLVSVSEASMLLVLGGGSEAIRLVLLGGAAALLPLAAAELLVQAGRRRAGARGVLIAGLLAGALLLVPGGLAPWYRLMLERPAERPVGMPRLGLVSALPLAWGEEGPLAPGSRPAAAYRLLEGRYRLVPLDELDARRLASLDALLLAQPRALAPGELVALDAWMRGGGRALLLDDPALSWPSALPVGDIRRAPPVGLLAPLLDHWGLRIEPVPRAGIVDLRVGGRRLVTSAPGRVASRSAACRVDKDGLVARCRIDAGRAAVVADADLLHDLLWTADGRDSATRLARLADNPFVVTDLIDELIGRAPSRDRVAWIESGRSPWLALLAAVAPLLLAGLVGAFLKARKANRLIHTPVVLEPGRTGEEHLG